MPAGSPVRSRDADLRELALGVASVCLARGWQLTTAESCTGGWVAKTCTDLAGSSDWFGTGLVTYSNAAKCALLGVAPATLERFGAVSEPVVREMACGALERAGADIAVAVSGIAGPSGGTAEKPVGTVWFAWSRRTGGQPLTWTRQCLFDGDRERVRRQAVAVALAGLCAT